MRNWRYSFLVLSEILTFIFFTLIGLEIREGLAKPKEALLPAIAALGGMVLPALLFLALNPQSNTWAVSMPTDVALAIGALSILGKRVNPAVRLFLLTLAIADDFFSLVVIGIFYHKDLHLSSAIFTLGAAAIGSLLPYRKRLIAILSPLAIFAIIPIYIAINLLSHLDFSLLSTRISLSVIIARVVGKVVGISLAVYLATRYTSLQLPKSLQLHEVVGVGFLSGMGLTVSLVIAEITVNNSIELNQVRIGLFFAALISGALGLAWLRRFPASVD